MILFTLLEIVWSGWTCIKELTVSVFSDIVTVTSFGVSSSSDKLLSIDAFDFLLKTGEETYIF